MAAPKKLAFAEFFWFRVYRGRGIDECWPWLARRREHGYGLARVPSLRRVRGAHRVAYFIATGDWPQVVRHTCDNPPCCNPRHLVGGTQAENVADMIERGRRASCSGEKNPRARLTREQVEEIRRRYVLGDGAALGREFGITRSNVHGIVTGRVWK